MIKLNQDPYNFSLNFYLYLNTSRPVDAKGMYGMFVITKSNIYNGFFVIVNFIAVSNTEQISICLQISISARFFFLNKIRLPSNSSTRFNYLYFSFYIIYIYIIIVFNIWYIFLFIYLRLYIL